MADDLNRKDGPEEKEAEKDWDWDAQTPSENFEIESLLTAKEETEKEETEAKTQEADPTQDADEAEDEIIENDDEEASDSSEGEEGCCIICGEKIRKSPSELYCNECREKYLRVNFGASHIILSVVMVFVAVIGIVMFFAASGITSDIIEGNKYAKKNLLSNALDSYSATSDTAATLNDGFNAFLQGISTNFKPAELFDAGTAAQKKKAVLMVKTLNSNYTSREEFCYAVDAAFTEKELKSEKYADVKKCYDFCKKMDETANDIFNDWNPLFEEYMDALENSEGKDVPSIDGLYKCIDEFAAKNPDAEPSTVSFYKFMTAYYESIYAEKSDKAAMLSYLKEAYEKAGEYGYFYADNLISVGWECQDTDLVIETAEKTIDFNPCDESAFFFAAKAYASKKDFDSAVNTCEKLREFNPDSLEYYIIQSEILRRKGDFNAAVEICEKGEEEGQDPEILRQKSIAYFLLEEKDKAVEAAKDAYEASYGSSYSGGSVSLEVLNTTALICYLAGGEAKETYDEINELLKSQNYEFEDSVKDVIKGDKTFEDVFMGEKGDI